MDVLNMLLSLLPFNGHKMDTGVIVTLCAFAIQQLLGVDHSAAVSMISTIMMAGGTVYAVVGKVHQLIKDKLAKPAPAAVK